MNSEEPPPSEVLVREKDMMILLVTQTRKTSHNKLLAPCKMCEKTEQMKVVLHD
jgi:hypothetical protein